ncbi:epimerase [Marinithermofilum abyssi]|uniref:Epimerase n=1 Tax=Marinithermofilum abyssi TaxID=1571185 RepID=A0A8J2VJ25_9BACL|nr:NAD(P)-dependent oxidoreductase [Marinithermofilum abyssi]GGE26295.1 epimerase [Marinithermofilum abyssi]
MKTVAELETCLARPSEKLVRDMAHIEGDILILGAGGKMGPSLAKLAKNAREQAGSKHRVIAVSRFSSDPIRQDLEQHRVDTIAADLLDEEQLNALPEAPYVIYLAGRKFGTQGAESLTWAMNTYLPGRVAEKFRKSRIVAFSTGNVYPLRPVVRGGASEEEPARPVGEYAQSCLGRERIFHYFSEKYGTPMVFFRLNYAIDLRYGVLLEIAQAIQQRRPIDLSMGTVNVIWQGDANATALRALNICSSPPKILNVTGPENVSVRWLAERFGERLGVEPILQGEECESALLSNASASHQLFGYPQVSLRQMIAWTADWVKAGGPSLAKPTHFQEREGVF